MGWNRSIKKERGGSVGIMAGCMSGMLQLFDCRQETTVDTTRNSSQATVRPSVEDGLCCTGIEAPKNSLEILPNAKSGAVEQKQRHQDVKDEDEDIPMGFEILTRTVAPKDSTSPNPKCKSPSVVARLMGIEILPDEAEREGGGGGIEKDSSVVNSINKDLGSSNRKLSHTREMKLKELNHELRILEKRCENIIRQHDPVPAFSRSLPASPRVSSARRSDAEHRLSLQIQKENVPPFVNINYVDGVPLASSPSSSTSSYSLRNLDTKKVSLGSNAGRPTSPRLVPSSNSPRLAKTKEENKLSTPPCSPRLRLPGQEDFTNKTKPRPENQTTTSAPKNSQKVTRIGTPIQAVEPRTRAAKAGPRIGPSVKIKPRFEVSVVKKNDNVGGGCGGESRTPRKDRSPPKIRESYVRVLDVKSGAPKKGQKPICDTLLKAHSVIPTTKASPRILLRTPVSGVAPPTQSRMSTATALDDDVPLDGSSDTHCSNLPVHASNLDIPLDTNLQVASALSKKPCYYSVSSTFPTPIHDIMPSSSPLSFIKGKGREKDTIYIYGYIKTVLELMGVRSSTKVSFTHWYSPSHPLDPTIFTKLDAYHHGHHGPHDGGLDLTMPNTRSNRKLAFQLVDELLRERLKPHLTMRPWMMMMMMMMGHGPCMIAMTGKQLLHDVWTDVCSFPSADCKIVQDIDGLVASDVNTSHFSSPINHTESDSVAEAILFRIGQDIADSLVSEAVVDLLSLKQGAFSL